jgi:pantothenate kinase
VLQNDFKIAFAPEIASTLLQNRLESSSNWLQYCFKTASKIQKCLKNASALLQNVLNSCIKVALKLLQYTSSCFKHLQKHHRPKST